MSYYKFTFKTPVEGLPEPISLEMSTQGPQMDVKMTITDVNLVRNIYREICNGKDYFVNVHIPRAVDCIIRPGPDHITYIINTGPYKAINTI